VVKTAVLALAAALTLAAQEQSKIFELEPGKKIPLSIVNSVGTRNAAPGDPVYLQTNFPIVANGRIVVPPGSYVTGTVTDVKRAGKIKGRAEIHLRFDSLMLPNGVIREFRASLGGIDGASNDKLDREEGAIVSPGSKLNDVKTVATTAATGAMLGGAAGGLASIGQSQTENGLGGWQKVRAGMGIGVAAGATAGIVTVLLTRGPDVVLARGTSVDMVLDRVVRFEESELDFSRPFSPPVQNR
jgi:type IV secretion system protein VirB10